MSHDVIIIGGGPAGMSALIWCHSLGLRGVLLEQSPELGGQMLDMFHRVLDYPGLIAENGGELRDHFAAQLDLLRLDYRTGHKIEEVDLRQRRARWDGEWLQGEAVIIATGARKRLLGIPGEERFEIRGVSFSATRDHSLYAGKKVSVIGGGDSAVQNSLLLASICPSVTLIHRSDRYRARPDWLKQAQENPRIIIIDNAEATAIEGGERVERLIIEDTRTGEVKAVETEGVFIRVGVAPNTEMFRGQVEMDEAGFIKTDQRQRTSVDLVYAAGDVCRPANFSIATAIGHGAIAAKDIAQNRN
ncbi:MAG TPA: FAD-dependent oxidoreductase [Blastocatellia bacterium]|jgi:thioredoxin reductase (NADPH)|nr:FAD-dependent oxidoreductase [Blastocatellia bacterium]